LISTAQAFWYAIKNINVKRRFTAVQELRIKHRWEAIDNEMKPLKKLVKTRKLIAQLYLIMETQ
jgi:hypothetical protein